MPIAKLSANIDINYECCGTGEQSILFLHGFGTTLETWRDLLPFLPTRFSSYLVDLKGFGDSSKPHDDMYSPMTHVTLISEFIRKVAIRRPHIVGHSFGAGVGLLLCLDKTSNAGVDPRSLTLIDAAVYQQPLPFFVSAFRHDLWRGLATALPELGVRMALRTTFYDQRCVTRQLIQRYVDGLSVDSAYAMSCVAKQLYRPESEQLLSNSTRTLAIPTKIIWGDHDRVISVEVARRLAREIPNSEVSLIANCGHVPHEEKPRETAAVMCDFWQQRRFDA
jgi:pimeloyl-ACP methyl ester carboxylesterase